MSQLRPTLIVGSWLTPTSDSPLFSSRSPLNREELPFSFPISAWEDLEKAARAAHEAFRELSRTDPEQRARFLERYADRIQQRLSELAALAHKETALPIEPRLAVNELPRTINQLRSAAEAARERSWSMPTIDADRNIRSMLVPIGPLLSFGPNNFPFACNSVCGGDFAAAFAVGCPIIAKANPGHPELSYQMAVEAFAALCEVGLPRSSFQMFYHCSNDDGHRLIRHPAIAVVSFTGSKQAGLPLKKTADEAGKPIFLEMGSVNPTVILPGALTTRFDQVVSEFVASALLGTGQFCTNPGLVLLLAGPKSEQFIESVRAAFASAPNGPLLVERGVEHLSQCVTHLQAAGAQVLQGGQPADGPGYHFQNTLLRAEPEDFLARPHELQTEAFGNVSLVVVAKDEVQLTQILETCEGSLTGCFYSDTNGSDDAMYQRLEPILRQKVGRLLNDKMPTGVTVSPATHHGGPFPAAWHPAFTAIGIPAALRRFTMLQCWENFRDSRLPVELRNKNLPKPIFRFIKGDWTKADLE